MDLKAGKTYGIKFLSKSVTSTVSDLEITLLTSNGLSTIDCTFTKINAGDTLGDSGGTDNVWLPQILTTEVWQEVKFTVPADIDAGDWYMQLVHIDSSNINIDEFSLFEVIQPDTFIMAGHNFLGTFTSSSYVRGQNLPSNLSNFAAGTDAETLVDIDADVSPDGKEIIHETFTAPTSIYPYFEIRIVGIGGETFEIGEMWLGDVWTWAQYSDVALTPYPVMMSAVKGPSNRMAPSNAKRRAALELKGGVKKLPPADADNWADFILANGYGKPFWLIIPDDTPLGVSEQLVFMQCKTPPKLVVDRTFPGFYHAQFDFEESGEGQ
jgi:hypothetical protein